jgi:sugar phosphate permease
MAFACFASLWLLEKKGVVKHNRFKKELSEAKQNGSIRLLIKRRIIIFSLVSILTGIVRTTVVFWLPTYFNEYLGYSPTKSASIFTVATLAITLTVFVTMFAYELFKRDMDATMLTMFIIASLCFLLVFLIKQPIINIIFIVLAIIASNSAATILWSMYCPSLKDTGMVSSATGFLTFIGYIGSSASSYVFAYMASAENIGWKLIVFVWFMLMVLGVLVTLPYGKIIKKFKISLIHHIII